MCDCASPGRQKKSDRLGSSTTCLWRSDFDGTIALSFINWNSAAAALYRGEESGVASAVLTASRNRPQFNKRRWSCQAFFPDSFPDQMVGRRCAWRGLGWAVRRLAQGRCRGRWRRCGTPSGARTGFRDDPGHRCPGAEQRSTWAAGFQSWSGWRGGAFTIRMSAVPQEVRKWRNWQTHQT